MDLRRIFVYIFLFIRPVHSGAHTKKKKTEMIASEINNFVVFHICIYVVP